MDLVSIIVPAFNCARYIDKCLRSICDQDYESIEIIVVIDGYDEDIIQICRRYKENDNRIQIIIKDNEGVSVARNVGMEKATGKWIAFIDGDDWIEMNYISSLIEKNMVPQADICICGYYTESDLSTIKSTFLDCQERVFINDEKRLLITNAVIKTNAYITTNANIGVPWAKLYKRDFLVKNNIKFVPALKRMQDMIFNLYAFQLADKVYYYTQPLYHYYKNLDNKKYRPNYDMTIKQIDEEIQRFIDYFGLDGLEELHYCKSVVLISDVLRLQYLHKDNKDNYSTKKKKIIELLTCEQFHTEIKLCKGTYLTKKYKMLLRLFKRRQITLIYYIYLLSGIKKGIA